MAGDRRDRIGEMDAAVITRLNCTYLVRVITKNSVVSPPYLLPLFRPIQPTKHIKPTKYQKELILSYHLVIAKPDTIGAHPTVGGNTSVPKKLIHQSEEVVPHQ